MSYRNYFNIDPEYFPQVNKRIIESKPDLWKKFYPHPSFINLLKATVDVLKRKQKLSIWVDGAYGTGKSHAVLTLKKLIEASEEDTLEYFEKYNLDKFLCKDFISEKNAGKILVCHRYGSSDISNDTDLIVAIQECIENTLKEAGIENNANMSLKNSLIRYFENDENKLSFDIYARGTYKNLLGGDLAEDVLNKLRNYTDDSLGTLINKLFKIPTVRGAFAMNSEELCDWIREIIEKNNLKELIFIWDEFSEYFDNNIRHLTGFQQIAELAATAPFCLMIVTHKAEGYFSDGDPDKRKILDRFISPIHISLPENIAFELMAQAMKITNDFELASKWERNKNSLNKRTMQSRAAVTKKINLTDKDLTNVLPIHPYAALLLQHISIYYTSTARSMFNFIKNDEGDKVKAFQWFINTHDFNSINPFITIDLLWSFFYESGRDKLAYGIKEVLNCYTSRVENQLIEEEKRVFKTILLLQAVSDRMTGDREIFLPNIKNLTLAFEGTDLEMKVKNIAAKLLNDRVITRIPLTGEVFSYCCNITDTNYDPAPFMNEAKSKTTKDMSFMSNSGLRNTIELTGALKLRYSLSYATINDFDVEIKKANNPSIASNKLYAIATFAKDSIEGAALKKKIRNFFEKNPESNVIVIDSSDCVLTDGEYSEFIENYAMALTIGQSDINLRKTYEGYAIEVLARWSKKIKEGDFYVFSRYSSNGERVPNINDLYIKLMEINKFHYPSSLEVAYTNVLNTMYDANLLSAGAICGITEELKGTFRTSNEAMKLENALKDAWRKPEYWKESTSYIATLKKDVDDIINKEFSKGDRIAISTIYSNLKAEPYGFMPCNLTAFILGFILKEYANGVYSYTDTITTIPLDNENLGRMISEIIKEDITPDKRYKDKYIVTITEAERAFNKMTASAFGIDEKYCVSVTDTRSRIREKMKDFSFPIWVIKYNLDNFNLKTNKDVICLLIDNYCGIANNQNIDGDKTDNEIAQSIGEICIANPDAIEDLKTVLTKDNCKSGMIEYLKLYKGGLLPIIASNISDNGQYINYLGYKFSSDAANWVWNKDTVNSKIDELITEYEIIEESNKILAKNVNFQETIRAWIIKIDQIKLSYSIIKNDLGEKKNFYEMLYNLKKSNTLLDSQKKIFLNLLKDNIDDFKSFMSNQSIMFTKACAHYIDDLSLDDIKIILDDDRYQFERTYILEPDVYIKRVQDAIKTYRSGLGYVELKKMWKDLTGTDSPYSWSEINRMPILTMVPSDEVVTARGVFGTINAKVTDDAKIAVAKDYLSKMSYIASLNDKDARDRVFKETFLREYELLFDDIEEVKKYLYDKVVDKPYHWAGNNDVFSKIKILAKAKYIDSGYEKAKNIVDEMPAEKVKEYLKQLIQDNIIVGLEIIKNS